MESKKELIDALTTCGYTEDEINLAISVETGKTKDIEEIDKIMKRLCNTIIAVSKHSKKQERLGFVPGISVSRAFTSATSMIPGSSLTGLVDTALEFGASQVAGEVNRATGGAVQIDPATLVGIFNNTLSMMGPDFKASGYTGGGGTLDSGGDTNPYAIPNIGTGFTYIPKPLEIRFTPDIPNTVYGEVTVRPEGRMDQVYNTGAQLRQRFHMSTIRLNLPNFGSANSQVVTNYFNQVFIPNYQVRAQGNVSFNIRSANTFTAAKLEDYFNSLLNALSIYYFYAHTYAYCAISENRNTALYRLRELFNTSDLQNLRLLEERLNGLPIPPRMNELCYWMFNIYRSSSVAGSDIIRFSPVGFDNTDAGKVSANQIKNGANILNNTLTELSTLENSKTSDLIARVCPNWVNAKVGSSLGIPLHDPTFCNLFWNAPLVDGSPNAEDNFKGYPEYININAETTYNSYCEEIDGLTQSMFSWHGGTAATNGTVGWMEGIPCAVGGQYTNRFDYVNGPEGENFYSYFHNPTAWYQRNDTYRYFNTNTNVVSFNEPDAVPVLGMSVASVQEATMNALGWLLNIGSVGSDAPLKSDITDENPITASGRGRRRKKK